MLVQKAATQTGFTLVKSQGVRSVDAAVADVSDAWLGA